MSPEQIMQIIGMAVPAVIIIVVAGVLGNAINNWLRIRNGYPLETQWGKAVYPQHSTETGERVKLLSQENAQLRAELGSVKDRLANVERIVTDGSRELDREIETLRVGRAN